MIVRDVSPRKYWWPLVNSLSIYRFKTASRKDLNVILFPPKTKVGWHTKPLPWDYYAFRFNFNYPLFWGEAQVPKTWKPAVSCSACKYPNDADYNFCQKCGFKKKLPASFQPPPTVEIDSERVNNRLKSLAVYRNTRPYQCQKSSLQRQLESYLWSLLGNKTLASASPHHVISFLTWRDKGPVKLIKRVKIVHSF